MTVYSSSLVFVSLTSLVYNIVLTIFRYSTWEIDDINGAVMDNFMFLSLFVASYVLSGYDDIALQALHLALAVLTVALAKHHYKKCVVGTKFKTVDLQGKVYIVTGSNVGIGFETAKQLIKMGATVVMACRSPEKGSQARLQIIEETKCAPSKLLVLKLDLCSFDSVRQFAEDFKRTGLALHALVNNAGVMTQDRMVTPDGLEMVFTANHLSHFLLTNLLLPEIEKTGGRVVNLTSSTHHMVRRFDFGDVMFERGYELFSTYAQSKLANILFTRELQRRLHAEGSTVRCFAVHPGCVRTEVTRNMSAFMQVGNRLATPIMRTLQKTPPEGAYCSLHAATAPELSGLRGGEYFMNCRPVAASEAAADETAAAQLWELSERLTGLAKS